MRISDRLAAGRTLSFEFFPPKREEEQAALDHAIADLALLEPSFVSVTYRGGRWSREHTTRIVGDLRRTTTLEPMPHLTCVAHSRAELVEILRGFRAAGIDNVLALGGDPLPGEESHRELEHAIELVELARDAGFESVGVAAHPAGHPRAASLEADRQHLAEKLALADFAITQFFFLVEEYERLREDLAGLGVAKPIVAGIMPITSLTSVRRMAELSGAPIPDAILSRVAAGGDDKHEVRLRGIEVASELCRDLFEADVAGLHFYVLNAAQPSRQICANVGIGAGYAPTAPSAQPSVDTTIVTGPSATSSMTM